MIIHRPSDIINLQDLIPNLEVYLAYATNDNFTGQIIPRYQQQIAFLTKVAADKLKIVQDDLEKYGMGLKVFDSYRPRSSVLWLQNNWRYQEENPKIRQRFYPDLTKEDLFVIGYIATRSSHSRASTIDLTIIDLNSKQELDMGTEFDFFGDKSHTAHPQLTLEQKKNRLLLKSLMETNGFINYCHEWWHYRLDNEPYNDCLDFPVQL